MATMIVCDRCGKRTGLLINKLSINRESLISVSWNPWKNYDLCTDCTHELKQWLKGKENSTEVTKNND